MEILPAIMPDSYDGLRDKLALVSGLVSTVQIDIMDGKFVKSFSWPYTKEGYTPDFSKILEEEEGMPFWDRLNFEMDLMVLNPEQEARKWMTAGASRLIVHFESIKGDAAALIEMIKKGGVEAGLAIGVETAVEEMQLYLPYVDFVQLMGIRRIGYQGQPFDHEVIEKLKKLKAMSPSTKISVDGGVSLETAPALIDAGADRLVVGSAIFESGDVETAISEFRSL